MNNAFLFPGQGSQSIGMGHDIYDTVPGAREKLDAACDILGYDLKEIMFEDSDNKLADTRYAQLAIFVCSAMYLEKARELDFTYNYTAGHSLGEYSALYAAGVLDFKTCLELVKKRAFEMSKANGMGGMAAVLGLTEEELLPLISKHEGAVIANLNTKTQIVISGSSECIESLAFEFEDNENIKFKRLNDSAPFHSPYMSQASEVMREAIEAVSFNEPKVWVVSNITGKPSRSISEIKENLIRQITGQVRWHDSILNLKEAGVEAFYECGYGGVLKKMNKAITLKPRCMEI